MSEAASPFRPRTVLAIVLFGALAFLLTLYLIGAGETDGGTNDGGTHAAANGLTGHAALVALLRSAGHEVTVSRSPGALEQGNLLILTPPHFLDGEELATIVNRRRYAGPTLVILPKWDTMEVPDNLPIESGDGWVVLGGASGAAWLADFGEELGPDFAFDQELEELPDRLPHWRGMGARGALPDPEQVAGLEGDALVPLVQDCESRTLAGYVDDDGYYPVLAEAIGRDPGLEEDRDTGKWTVMIVAEPDLTNNYGLADRTRAIIAHRLVDLAIEGEDLPIVFDLTVNGLGRTQNLLTLAFRPPFLAATLALLIALAIVAWRGFRRFGPPIAPEREIAHGKRQLVENSAGFLRRSGRLHLLAEPYIALMQARIGRLLGLKRGDPQAIDRALARRPGAESSFSEQAERMRRARKPRDIVRAAGAIRNIERTVTP